jgi:hypothetical protein
MDEKGDDSTPAFAEILPIHIPRITHRGKHIGDMKGTWRGNNSFGHTMATAYDEVITFQVETLYGDWK